MNKIQCLSLALVLLLAGCAAPRMSLQEQQQYLSELPKNQGSTTDPRDGSVYKTVRIGDLVWFAENLHFKRDGAHCYDEKESNCNTYGMLYDLSIITPNVGDMNLCPEGWVIPTFEQWQKLREIVKNMDDLATTSANPLGFNLLWSGKYAPAPYTAGYDGIESSASFAFRGHVVDEKLTMDEFGAFNIIKGFFYGGMGNPYLGNEPIRFYVRCVQK